MRLGNGDACQTQRFMIANSPAECYIPSSTCIRGIFLRVTIMCKSEQNAAEAALYKLDVLRRRRKFEHRIELEQHDDGECRAR